jgi:hypothetical protein
VLLLVVGAVECELVGAVDDPVVVGAVEACVFVGAVEAPLVVPMFMLECEPELQATSEASPRRTRPPRVGILMPSPIAGT